MSKPQPRRIEYLPLDELRGDPRNPKTHSLDTIQDSVNRFGLIDQIVRDDRTGYLISGHGRTESLRQMHSKGEPAPDGVEVAPDGTWRVPVAVGWESKDDREAGAALIALNRSTELGGWEDTALHEILSELDSLEGVGFNDSDISELENAIKGPEFFPGNSPLKSPEFDGGSGIILEEGKHTCPACGFNYDE